MPNQTPFSPRATRSAVPADASKFEVRATCRVTTHRSFGSGWQAAIRWTLLACTLSAACILQAAEVANYYFDPTGSTPGDGSLAKPWVSFASIPWVGIQSQLSTPATVVLHLKRGTIFHEKLTIGASGSPGNPLIIRSYGDGPRPKIHAGATLEDWSLTELTQGRIWQFKGETPASIFTIMGAHEALTKGVSPASLNDLQWCIADQKLYVRMDAEFERDSGPILWALIRDKAIDCRSRHDIHLEDLDLLGASLAAIQLSGGSNFELRRCSVAKSTHALEILGATNVTAVACEFGQTLGQGVFVKGPATTARFHFSLFSPGPTGGPSTLIQDNGSDVSFLHCTFIGSRSRHIQSQGSNTLSVVNSILSVPASSDDTQAGHEIMTSAGTANVSYSLVQPNGQTPEHIVQGVTFGPGCIHTSPGFQRNASLGFLCLGLDDSGSFPAFTNLTRIADARGIKLYLALDGVQDWTPFAARLQQSINDGHDVLCHTTTHSLLAETNALTVQYRGTGSNPTLAVSNNAIVCRIDGTDFAPIGLSTSISKVASAVSRIPGFTARIWTSLEAGVPGIYLKEIPPTPLATPTTLTWDMNHKWNVELKGWQDRVRTLFTTPAGDPYVQPFVAYPSGSHSPDVHQVLQNFGFKGARTTFYPGRKLRNLDLYTLNAAPVFMGRGAQLPFELDLDDQGGTYHFVSSNITFSTDAFEGSHSGIFNGTNAFAIGPLDPIWDMSLGDWHIATAILREPATSDQVLFHLSADAANGLRAILSPDGHVSLVLTRDSAEILRLASPPSTLPADGVWRKLKFRQTADQWRIEVNGTIVALTNSPARSRSDALAFVLGCELDGAASTPGRFFHGKLDEFSHSKHTYYNTQALLDTAAQVGFTYIPYTHGYFNSPEMLEIVLDAGAEYPGGSATMTSPTRAFERILASSHVASNRWVTLTNLPAPIYRLTAKSKALRSANAASVQGIPNLEDAEGIPVTDAQGTLLIAPGELHMGAFQTSPLPTETATPRISAAWNGGQLTLSWPVAAGTWKPFSSTVLLNPAPWSPIASLPSLVGTNWVVSVTTTGASETFYRLQRP